MAHSRLLIAAALVTLCAGCGQQAAVTALTTTPVPSGTTAQAAAAQPDPDAQCKSWGIQPGSPGYKQCVDGMKEAANAEGSAPLSSEPLQADAANVRADMTRQRDEMRKQMNDDVKAAASNPDCVTTTNGSNTSVSCPQSP